MEDKDQNKQIGKKELRGKSSFRKNKVIYINILKQMRRVHVEYYEKNSKNNKKRALRN